MGDFCSIPILDYGLIERGEKDVFLKQLRCAFVNVGFCYLKDPPIDGSVIKKLIMLTPQFFDLPQEKKDRIGMINSPHFLGYARVGSERTRGAVDQRELCDFSTPFVSKWKDGDPDFWRLWGECQWPNESDIPDFKSTLLAYMSQVESLSFEFIHLLAESLFIPPTNMDRYYDSNLQHRCKLVRYPVFDPSTSDQGVGAHFDGGFLTFLLQVSSQRGLQVQNFNGDWIDAPPIPDTLVVNIGKGLETATKGVAKATSHRVLSPCPESGPRYSIPFFQNISPTVRVSELSLYSDGLPREIEEMTRARGMVCPTDSINYAEYGREESGLAQLIARIKSHPDVGKRHYPARYREIFGDMGDI